MQRILHGKPPQRNISTGESSQFPVSAAGLDLVSCLGLHFFFSRKYEARVPTKEIDFFATGQHADSFLAHVFWIWSREASTSLIKPHITTPNHPVIRRDCTTHLLVLLLLKSIFQVFSPTIFDVALIKLRQSSGGTSFWWMACEACRSQERIVDIVDATRMFSHAK